MPDQTTQSNFPSLILHPGRERSLINRHPWVFSGAIAKTAAGIKNGDIVQVQTSDDKLLGYGFWSRQSQISVRIIAFGPQDIPVHSKAFWHARVQAAYALRQRLPLGPGTDCYRLIHAEGDQMPGLIADVYGKTVVLQVLTRGMERMLPFIAEAILSLGFQFIYLKIKKTAGSQEGVSLSSGWYGPVGTTTIEIHEHHNRFVIDLETGQKTGFFLDQRDARALLQSLATGRRVLNTFSYTGGFSIAAMAGGASQVMSVDASKGAIQEAVENAELNGYGPDRHQAIAADCFDYLKALPKDAYDVIVLDPPAFAKTAAAVKTAARGYKELNLKAITKVAPSGLVFTFSCSQAISVELFRKIVFSAAADAGRHVRILYQTTQPPDHPISIYHPEGEYLKGLVLEVE